MAVNTTKGGGIYIEIGGTAQPLYEVLDSAKGHANKVAGDISKSFEKSMSNVDASRVMNDVTREFARVKTALQGAGADLSAYKKQFQDMGKEIGLSGKQLESFANAQVRAFQKKNATDTTQAMRQIQRLTGASADEMNRLSKELGGVGNEFQKAAERSGSFTGGLGIMARYAAGLIAVDKIKDFAVAAFNTAARYETLGVVVHQVGQQAGYSAVEVDKHVSALRRMGIAGVEARKTLTQLIQAQVDMSKAPALARIAQDAAVIGGTNSSDAFERMVYGIQSAQVEVLRTIGLNVNFEQSYAKLASQLGKTTAELTEQEKVQARINTVIEAGVPIMGTYEAAMTSVGKQISSLDRVHKEFLTDVGSFFTEIASSSGILSDYTSGIEEVNTSILLLRGLMSGLSFGDMDVARDTQELRDLVEGQKAATDEVARFSAQLSAVKGQLSTAGFSFFKNELASLQSQFKAGELGIDAYRRSLKDLQVMLRGSVNLPAIDAPQKDILNIKGQVEGIRAFYNKTAVGAREGKIKEIEDKLASAAVFSKEFGPDYEKIRSGLQKELDSLLKIGSGSDSKLSGAREQIQKIREEIDLLNGSAAKSENSLDQKIREISKVGVTAGLSSVEIEKLQSQFSTAFESNTLKELNKELFSVEGNMRALQQLESADKVGNFEKRLSLVKSLSSEEKDLLLGRYAAALSMQSDVKDAQTNLSFIKEFSDLSGNYGLSIEYQNKMITAQANILRSQLTPELKALIPEWEELKRLQTARDPLSGSIRGLQQYANEATDMAKGMEKAWTSGFTAMEDALVKFTMSGKLSFTDMANSIISDLIRISIRSSITGPLASGLGSLFSGLGSSSSLPVIGGPTGGGVVPGYIHHSGGVVGSGSAPTRSLPSSVFSGAPKFHSGGGMFAPDEYPAILQKGEIVIPKSLVQGSGRSGGYSSSAAPQVNVNIQNNTGAAVSQRTRTDNMGNKSIEVMIGDAVAKQTAKPGTSMNRVVRQATGGRARTEQQ